MRQDVAIVCPPYTDKSGGVRALYCLCRELRVRGVQAALAARAGCRIVARPGLPLADTTLSPDWRRQALHVVPEVGPRVDGPPVVWWLLNRPGAFPGHRYPAVSPAEPRYAWHRTIDPVAPLLAVDTIDPALFRRDNGRGGLYRGRTATYVGKGKLDPTVIPAGAVRITRDWPGARAHTAALLREIDLLISFDPFTALNVEAVLCGTPVLCVVPTDDWRRPAAAEIPGLVFTAVDLPRAREQLAAIPGWYEGVRQGYNASVERFIQEQQL